MRTNESAEDYLETILLLSHRLPVVRSVDIANEMGYKKSSISIAMKKLREQGHIQVSNEGYITLTRSGAHIANTIYERHEFLSSWLVKWGVSREIADRDACRIEHVISAESFQAMKGFLEKHSCESCVGKKEDTKEISNRDKARQALAGWNEAMVERAKEDGEIIADTSKKPK